MAIENTESPIDYSETKRRCRECGDSKYCSEFYSTARSGRVEYDVMCKLCRCASNKRRYSRNRRAILDRQRRYQINKGRRAIKSQELLSRYGISIEDFERMERECGGLCEICGREGSFDGTKKLCVDHCHATGVVRGLLCDKCNMAIGYLSDSPLHARKAMEYLARHVSRVYA